MNLTNGEGGNCHVRVHILVRVVSRCVCSNLCQRSETLPEKVQQSSFAPHPALMQSSQTILL